MVFYWCFFVCYFPIAVGAATMPAFRIYPGRHSGHIRVHTEQYSGRFRVHTGNERLRKMSAVPHARKWDGIILLVLPSNERKWDGTILLVLPSTQGLYHMGEKKSYVAHIESIFIGSLLGGRYHRSGRGNFEFSMSCLLFFALGLDLGIQCGTTNDDVAKWHSKSSSTY